jgi:hypothetical protein
VLKDWTTYAKNVSAELSKLMDQLIETRSKMDPDAYARSDGLKALFKRLNTDLHHLRATIYTCAVMESGIVDSPQYCRVFRQSDKIQAVVQYASGSPWAIEELAGNPRNIVPDYDQTDLVRGLARAALSLSILELREATEGTGRIVSLIPHNRKTKRVYNALGFEIPGVGSKPDAPEGSGSKRMINARTKQIEASVTGSDEYQTAKANDDEAGDAKMEEMWDAVADDLAQLEGELDRLQNRTNWHAAGTGAMELPLSKQQEIVTLANLDVPEHLKDYEKPT